MEGERQMSFDERYDAVVVGAGLGGLTSGALLAKAGLKVLIVERQERPGGFAKSFERNGFTFQVPQFAYGCSPNGTARAILDHLGVDVTFKPVDPYHRYIYPEHDLSIGTGLDSLEERLKEQFVPRTADIKAFFERIAKVSELADPQALRHPYSPGSMFKSMKVAKEMLQERTFEDVLDRTFEDDRLKSIVSTAWPCAGSPPWEISSIAMMVQLARMDEGAHFPAGGFSALSEALTDAYLGFGGSMLLGYEVTSINTEGGRASGVETHPRSKVVCSSVISDADSKRTLIKLVDRENFTSTLLEKVDSNPISISGFSVNLGLESKVDRDGIAPGTIFYQPSYDLRAMADALARPTEFPHPGTFPWMLTAHSLVEPSLAPPGCSSITITVPGVPYGFKRRWGVESGGIRGDRYKEIKEKYAEIVVKSVSQIFPDLIKDVRAYDVCSPITYERYTMALDGCWSDSSQVPRQTLFLRPGPTTPLKGLYMAGSKSATGGGVGPTIVSGLLAADCVLKGKFKELF